MGRVVLGMEDIGIRDGAGSPRKVPEALADMVRRERRAAGMTQQELADACSTGQSRISAVERGNAPLPIGLLVRIAAAAGKKVEISIQ